MRFERWRTLSIAMMMLACLVVAGCGDNDSSQGDAADAALSTSATTETPANPAKGSPEEFADQLAKAVASAKTKKQCGPLQAINRRSAYKFPCPSTKEVRSSLAIFEREASATHGTVAVIDYKSGRSPSGATMLVYRTPRNQWSVSRYGIVNVFEREDDSKSRASFDRTVDTYLAALREDDCDAFAKSSVTSTKDEAVICRKDMARAKSLAAVLKANPDATPEYLGGDAIFGFYGLSLDKPRLQYRTIGVALTDPESPYKYRVLDVIRGPVQQ